MLSRSSSGWSPDDDDDDGSSPESPPEPEGPDPDPDDEERQHTQDLRMYECRGSPTNWRTLL